KLSSRAIPHSERRLLTGFASAALIAWKLMVNSVINIAAMPDAINTPGPMLTRYGYFWSHCCRKYKAMGEATTQLRSTSTTNSRESNNHTWAMEAPNTLR